MCTQAYIAFADDEDHTLTDEANGLFLYRISKDDHLPQEILGSKNIYQPGSFMGCTCGFAFGSYLKQEEDHAQRLRSAKALHHFLTENSTSITGILTLYNYHHTNREEFPKLTFPLDSLISEAFEFEDDVLYTLP